MRHYRTDVETAPRKVFVMSLRTITAGVSVAAAAGFSPVHSGMVYLQASFRQAKCKSNSRVHSE